MYMEMECLLMLIGLLATAAAVGRLAAWQPSLQCCCSQLQLLLLVSETLMSSLFVVGVVVVVVVVAICCTGWLVGC